MEYPNISDSGLTKPDYWSSIQLYDENIKKSTQLIYNSFISFTSWKPLSHHNCEVSTWHNPCIWTQRQTFNAIFYDYFTVTRNVSPHIIQRNWETDLPNTTQVSSRCYQECIGFCILNVFKIQLMTIFLSPTINTYRTKKSLYYFQLP